MHELQYYLTKVDCGEYLPDSLGYIISAFPDILDFESFDIYLLSIPSFSDNGFSTQIRKELFSLYPHFKLKICDLGCLKIGNNLSDTIHSYNYVYEHIQRIGKVLLVLNAHCFTELLKINKTNNSNSKTVIFNNSFYYPTFEETKNNLLPFSTQHSAFVGLQNYLSSQDDYVQASSKNVITYRLGEIIESPKSVEPLLRDASAGFASLSVLEKSTEFKILGGSANGISIHNFCQLFYYAGRSGSMNQFVVDGNSFLRSTSENLMASVIAQSAWHFLLGKSQTLIFDKSINTYKSYYISHLHENVEFCFYEDLKIKIWWLEISIDTCNIVIGASYEDYKKMQDGEIPKLVAHTLSLK